jgi:hypothetical protein
LEGWDPTYRSRPHASVGRKSRVVRHWIYRCDGLPERAHLSYPSVPPTQWSPLESNQPPLPFQGNALPAELGDHLQPKAEWLAFQARLQIPVVGMAGLEPAASHPRSVRATYCATSRSSGTSESNRVCHAPKACGLPSASLPLFIVDHRGLEPRASCLQDRCSSR